MSEPISEFELALAKKVGGASMRLGSASKRFIRDICAGHVKKLSAKGESFLAHCAYTYRRQYTLTPQEMQWINERPRPQEDAKTVEDCKRRFPVNILPVEPMIPESQKSLF